MTILHTWYKNINPFPFSFLLLRVHVEAGDFLSFFLSFFDTPLKDSFFPSLFLFFGCAGSLLLHVGFL